MKPRYLLVLGVAILMGADDPKKELAKLDGTWRAVSMEVDGNKFAADDVKAYSVTIKDGKYVAKMGNDAYNEGSLKIDASKKPKSIDVMPSKGDNEGKTMAGIYEIDGDTLKICLAQPDGERPREFESKAGSGRLNVVYKKSK
jgi:uncharacterized protein (TIGR03067 family)